MSWFFKSFAARGVDTSIRWRRDQRAHSEMGSNHNESEKLEIPHLRKCRGGVEMGAHGWGHSWGRTDTNRGVQIQPESFKYLLLFRQDSPNLFKISPARSGNRIWGKANFNEKERFHPHVEEKDKSLGKWVDKGRMGKTRLHEVWSNRVVGRAVSIFHKYALYNFEGKSWFQLDLFHCLDLPHAEYQIFYQVNVANHIEYGHLLKDDTFIHDQLDAQNGLNSIPKDQWD